MPSVTLKTTSSGGLNPVRPYRLRCWLARKDSNLRSPDPESGARIRSREPSRERGGQRSLSDSGMSQAHILALVRRNFVIPQRVKRQSGRRPRNAACDCAGIDIFRFDDDGKVVERIGMCYTTANDNGMFGTLGRWQHAQGDRGCCQGPRHQAAPLRLLRELNKASTIDPGSLAAHQRSAIRTDRDGCRSAPSPISTRRTRQAPRRHRSGPTRCP
jgi:hypothetical protein